MSRGLAYNREVRNKNIRRKKRICNEVMKYDWYKHDGQYSKGKIHCSCALCNYSKVYDLPTYKELKANEEMRLDLKDLDLEDCL